MKYFLRQVLVLVWRGLGVDNLLHLGKDLYGQGYDHNVILVDVLCDAVDRERTGADLQPGCWVRGQKFRELDFGGVRDVHGHDGVVFVGSPVKKRISRSGTLEMITVLLF